MQSNVKMQSVENRPERTHYTEVLKDLQTASKRPFQHEIVSYSEYQNFLYKRALFGLKVYTPEEVKIMHWEKKARIQKVHKRTQVELNLLKQSRLITITNHLFDTFLHYSGVAVPTVGVKKGYSSIKALFLTNQETDPDFTCNISFRDIRLTREEIIDHLLRLGLLPHNFKTIK